MRIIGRPLERIATSLERLPDVANAHAERTRNGGVLYQPLTTKNSRQQKVRIQLSLLPSPQHSMMKESNR